MESIKVSDIVLSLKGRDRGRLFVVLAVEGEYLMLADGKGRRAEKPKRKKAKHTQLVNSSGGTRVTEKLLGGEKVTNAELRRELLSLVSETEGGMPVG